MSLVSKIIQNDIEQNPQLVNHYKEQDEKLEFAMTIVNLRNEINWSQEKLAEKLNVSQTMIEDVENGDVLPTMSLLRSIANVTGKELRISYV
jgi:ribosome-binding protein aMBF1 (putative translation factor)